MIGLELVVVLGAAVLVGNVLGQHFRVAPPVVLLVVGALIGLVPAVRQTQLPPAVLLLLFLPVLLYWESPTTSMREIRSNLRGIVLLSTVLVILTAGAVAVAGHALGLPRNSPGRSTVGQPGRAGAQLRPARFEEGSQFLQARIASHIHDFARCRDPIHQTPMTGADCPRAAQLTITPAAAAAAARHRPTESVSGPVAGPRRSYRLRSEACSAPRARRSPRPSR